MSRELPTGTIRFESVFKEYVLGKTRAHLAAALPFGSGLGRGERIAALRDVSFAVEPGQALALMGPNGAGKSTALKCLAGVTRATRGSVSKSGRVVALIELGIGFHPDLTGHENALFAGSVAGLRRAALRDMVDAAFEFSELEKFASTPVKRYSSGMVARLSFGISANLAADILLVDEILAVGDFAFARKCYEHLRSMREQHGTTLVFVSHNEWMMKETCEFGVLLREGHVEAIGPVRAVIEKYHASGRAAAVDVHHQGSRIRFLSVDVQPETGTLQLHQPVDIRCEVAIAEGVTDAAVGLFLVNKDGLLVWATYSDEGGISLRTGVQTVTVSVADVLIAPGPCHMELLAFQRSEPQGEDARKLDFLIQGPSELQWEHGIVHSKSTWTCSDSRSA